MDHILHTYLTRLRIISKCPVNGKLSTIHNDLNIYYGGIVDWLYRKVYGDNKDNATKYLIDLYREINSFSDQLMYNIETEQSEIRKRKKTTMLVSLTEKLKESLTGIRNLIGTYKDYLKIVSLLECLEQDVIIPQYQILLKFIPLSYHTEILKTAITYSHTYTSGIFGRDRSLSESDAGIIQHTIYQNTSDSVNIPSNIDSSNILEHNMPIARSMPIPIPTQQYKKKKDGSFNN